MYTYRSMLIKISEELDYIGKRGEISNTYLSVRRKKITDELNILLNAGNVNKDRLKSLLLYVKDYLDIQSKILKVILKHENTRQRV